MPLPVAAVVVGFEAEDFMEVACVPAVSTAVACALLISGAVPFTPGVFTADATIALQAVFDRRIR